MGYLKYFLLIFTFVSASAQNFIELDGVKIPTTLKIIEDNTKTKLILNGCGIRDKMWISLYVQALYLIEKSSDAIGILNDNSTMAIKLHVTSSLITRQKLVDGLRDGIKKSLTGKMVDIQEQLNLFNSYLYNPIKENDVYDFIYNSSNVNC